MLCDLKPCCKDFEGRKHVLDRRGIEDNKRLLRLECYLQEEDAMLLEQCGRTCSGHMAKALRLSAMEEKANQV